MAVDYGGAVHRMVAFVALSGVLDIEVDKVKQLGLRAALRKLDAAHVPLVANRPVHHIVGHTVAGFACFAVHIDTHIAAPVGAWAVAVESGHTLGCLAAVPSGPGCSVVGQFPSGSMCCEEDLFLRTYCLIVTSSLSSLGGAQQKGVHQI